MNDLTNINNILGLRAGEYSIYLMAQKPGTGEQKPPDSVGPIPDYILGHDQRRILVLPRKVMNAEIVAPPVDFDDSDKLQESNLFYEFWKMYKTELLKVREEIVKGKILRVKEVSDKLLSISNDIKNDLEKIRDEIKEKYKLSAKELVVEGMEYI